MARERCVSLPYQVTWRPGWISEAGRDAAMVRAVSRISSGSIPVRGYAHSGDSGSTCALSCSKPTACCPMYSRS